jgi:hypothetical protein
MNAALNRCMNPGSVGGLLVRMAVVWLAAAGAMAWLAEVAP